MAFFCPQKSESIPLATKSKTKNNRGMNTHATDYRLNLTFACLPNADAPNDKVRFTGVAYSGGVIPNHGYMGDVAINLASLQNPDAIDLPVLIDHNASIDAIAGKGALTRIGNALHITGELTQATDAGKKISALMAEGYPLQMSVGMQSTQRELKIPEQINGQQMHVNYVFENSRIIEVSFVPTGADPHTSAAQFSAQPFTNKPEGVTMTRTPEDQALIDKLETQIKQSAEQISEMKASMDAADSQQRTTELSALFAELGRDVPADTKAYHEMNPEVFTTYAADLRAMKPLHKDRSLFSAQSVHKADTNKPEQQDRAKVLFTAVQSISKKV